MKVHAKFVVWLIFIAMFYFAPQGANTALAKGKSKDLGKIAMEEFLGFVADGSIQARNGGHR